MLLLISVQDESTSHSTSAEVEKVAPPSKDDDDSSSDLSNDTPLSELIKESNAKAEAQQKTAAAAAAAAAAESAAENEKEGPDVFESDSNDDKCLGSIKREIQSLSAQKENESIEDASEISAEPTATIQVEEKEEEKSEDIILVETATDVIGNESP